MINLKYGDIPRLLTTEYASYRKSVVDALALILDEAAHSLSHPLVLYDPMAGTAPLLPIAEHRGFKAYFNDLNCLHLYVNAAKTFSSYMTFKDLGPDKVLNIICRITSGIDKYPRTATEHWIEEPVLEELVDAWRNSERESTEINILIKAMLLLAVRHFSSFIRTKNPTWLKPGGLRSSKSVEQVFRNIIEQLNEYYKKVYANHSDIKGGKIFLTVNDVTRSAPKYNADVIITSPPFCNRIDWDRIYAPEHYFLDTVGAWHTKTEFIGTTTIKEYPKFELDLKFVTSRSPYVDSFLKEVKSRQIDGERRSNYYVKYFVRYFAGLFHSFDTSVNALAKKNSGIYFVVQENVHRGILVKLGQAIAESLAHSGFQAFTLDYSWDRHHLGLQNISKKYRLVTAKQRECIWKATRLP